jgi:hypothetical protein
MTEPVFDNNQSADEGWCISECFGSANGPWQLQKCDEQDVFKTDIEAWRFVVDCAEAGSEYHKQALQFLKDHNRTEHDCIVDTIKRRAIA